MHVQLIFMHSKIIFNNPKIDYNIAPLTQQQAKSTVHIERKKEQSANTNETIGKLSDNLHRATKLASEKGVSTWLLLCPSLHMASIYLYKATFRDAICLRYGWTPQQLLSHCTCGARFSISHALSCPKGGFPIIRHNELRDLCAEPLTEVCPSVSIEPHLQPLNGEQLSTRMANTDDGARLDVAANGFWGGRLSAHFSM